MTNSTLSMSYCAGDTLSRGHSALSMNTPEKTLILDVRRSRAMAATPRTIPGAVLAPDLAEIPKHAGLFRDISKLRLFCVHGHERSISAAILMRDFDCEVEDIPGGLEAFEEAGGETVSVVEGKTGVLGSSRLWLFDNTIEHAFVAWAMARFIDPLSDYRFVPAAHRAKVQIELESADANTTIFQEGGNPLNALLEEFDFQNFPILTRTVIPFLQQPATSQLLQGVSSEDVIAFCDHVWTLVHLKNQTL
ncbi:MAG: hypothetical protein ABJO09_21465 [Hyphomicrobiales bacterium]